MFLLDESYPETIARAMTEDNYKKKQGVKRQVCTTRQRFDERLRAKSSTTFSVISQRWTNRLIPFLILFSFFFHSPPFLYVSQLTSSFSPPPSPLPHIIIESEEVGTTVGWSLPFRPSSARLSKTCSQQWYAQWPCFLLLTRFFLLRDALALSINNKMGENKVSPRCSLAVCYRKDQCPPAAAWKSLSPSCLSRFLLPSMFPIICAIWIHEGYKRIKSRWHSKD